MESRDFLRQLAERASKFAINLDGRIERDQTPCIWGGNAVVYCGTLSSEGTAVAIQTVIGARPTQANTKDMMVMSTTSTLIALQQVLREAHDWSKPEHPNVLPLLGITAASDLTVSLVITWMKRGNGRSYVPERHKSNNPRPLIGVITAGLSYLHSHLKGLIIHGD